MDFSRFKVGDWLLIGGGLVMLVLGMALPWATVSTEGFSDSGNNPFDYFFTGGLAWLLVVGAGIVAALLALGVIDPTGAPWPIVLVGATGLATLLMLLRLLLGAGDILGEDLDRGPGMYVAFVAAAVALAGAVMIFRSAGGDLKDLTDMDRMRASFGRPGSSSSTKGPTPPPPPAGGPMPPPPPPGV